MADKELANITDPPQKIEEKGLLGKAKGTSSALGHLLLLKRETEIGQEKQCSERKKRQYIVPKKRKRLPKTDGESD